MARPKAVTINVGAGQVSGLLLAPAAYAAPACEDAAGVARAFFEATSGDDGDFIGKA